MESGCWGGQGLPRTVAPRWWMDISYERLGFNFAVWSRRMDTGTSFWDDIISCFKVLPLYSLLEDTESIRYSGNLGDIRTANVPINTRNLPLQERSRSFNLAKEGGVPYSVRWMDCHPCKTAMMCSRMCLRYCHRSESPAPVHSGSAMHTRSRLSGSCQATVSFVSSACMFITCGQLVLFSERQVVLQMRPLATQ